MQTMARSASFLRQQSYLPALCTNTLAQCRASSQVTKLEIVIQSITRGLLLPMPNYSNTLTSYAFSMLNQEKKH